MPKLTKLLSQSKGLVSKNYENGLDRISNLKGLLIKGLLKSVFYDMRIEMNKCIMAEKGKKEMLGGLNLLSFFM